VQINSTDDVQFHGLSYELWSFSGLITSPINPGKDTYNSS